MIWVKQGIRSYRLMLIAGLLSVIVGCASQPSTEEDAQAAAAEAREQLLKEEFSAAVESLQAGELDVARAEFERLHQDHPQRTGPIANLGIVALEQEKTGEAQDYFEQVVELDERHVIALNYLGVIARKAGQFDAAESYYRRTLAANPDYLPAVMNLAILLDIYLGRPAEALPLYEQYQSSAEEPNPRLEDWIFDVKNRM